MTSIDAAWAQVIVESISATATFFAVLVALWLPRSERRRAALAAGRSALALSDFAIVLRGKLETELLKVDPKAELRELRLLMSLAERVILRDETPASLVAVYMLQRPEVALIEKSLAEWVDNIALGTTYNAPPLRQLLAVVVPILTNLSPVKRFAD